MLCGIFKNSLLRAMQSILVVSKQSTSHHHSELQWIGTPDKLFEIHAMTAFIKRIA
jgi:hypothetical protein